MANAAFRMWLRRVLCLPADPSSQYARFLQWYAVETALKYHQFVSDKVPGLTYACMHPLLLETNDVLRHST